MPKPGQQDLNANPEDFNRNLVIAFLISVCLAVWIGGAYDPAPYMHAAKRTKEAVIFRVLAKDHNILISAVLNPYLRHPYLFLLGALIVALSPLAYGITRRVWRDFYIASYWFLSFVLVLLLAFYVPDLALPDSLTRFANVWWRVTILLCSSGVLLLVGLLIAGPKSLRALDIFHNPSAYDVMDLAGAATLPDLKHSGLLVKSGRWPSPDSKAMRGRICIGRFYEDGRPTRYFVAPHVQRLQQTLVVAPTGSGKTMSLALPWSRELPFQGQSVFVLDFKGDMMGHIKAAFTSPIAPSLWAFDPLSQDSVRWNPLREPVPDTPEFFESQDAIAQALYGKIDSGHYEYFDVIDFRILKAGIRLVSRGDVPTLKTLHDLFLSKQTLQRTMDEFRNTAEDHEFQRIEADVSASTDSHKYTFTERIQGVRNKLDAFAHPAIQRVTGLDSDFRLERLMEKPSCLVFAAPLRMGLAGETLAAMAVRLIQYQLHRRYGHEGGKLFLILDEFSKLTLDHGQTERFISVCRSAAAVSVVILQDLYQLHPDARVCIAANCQDRYILRGASAQTAKWFSDSLANRQAWTRSVSASTSRGTRHQSESGGLSAREESVPVLRSREIILTGGLQRGAWLHLPLYSGKPILVDLTRPFCS